jgi:hypothetical protein
MQRILRSRTSRIKSHPAVCRAGKLSAPDPTGTTSANGVATLAPAFGQALPSLAEVRAEYNHEVNAELVYELCAALVHEGLGTEATWKQSGSNALRFARHAMMSGIGAERGDLLQRNVEYHLEVSDQLGRAGSDTELESGQLVALLILTIAAWFGRFRYRSGKTIRFQTWVSNVTRIVRPSFMVSGSACTDYKISDLCMQTISDKTAICRTIRLPFQLQK